MSEVVEYRWFLFLFGAEVTKSGFVHGNRSSMWVIPAPPVTDDFGHPQVGDSEVVEFMPEDGVVADDHVRFHITMLLF